MIVAEMVVLYVAGVEGMVNIHVRHVAAMV
jgi:hypothetical protein